MCALYWTSCVSHWLTAHLNTKRNMNFLPLIYLLTYLCIADAKLTFSSFVFFLPFMLSWKTLVSQAFPQRIKGFCQRALNYCDSHLLLQLGSVKRCGMVEYRGRFQVALCNQREVVGSSARNKFSPAVISDWKWWKWGGTSRPRSCSWLALWPCVFFSYQRKYTVRHQIRRVSITYGRGRRLVSGINPPDWYERQTAVSTLEFRSQTVSPLLQAIAPLLIDHLIKSRSAPNQASQISDFFFFFSLCLEIGPSFFCVLHQLCRLRSRLTLFELVLLMFPGLCRTENVAGFQPANQHPFRWDGNRK